MDIKHYVVVDTEALVELVEAIGGVNFDIPINMNYDDYSQDLHINLKAGYQLLDGNMAEQLLRFRHNNNGTSYSFEYGDNDTGRMRTQREFISAVLSQTLKPQNIFKLGSILDIASRNIRTNISLSLAKDYIPYAVEFKTEDLKTGVLPGINEKWNGVWLFMPDTKTIPAYVDELFSLTPESGLEDVNNTTGNNTTNTVNNTTKNQTNSSY